MLPPLEPLLRFHQNSYTPSLLLAVLIFLDLQDNSFSGIFRWWHNIFLNSCVHFILVRLFHDWVFFADRSGANTKQLSISHGGQPFMVSPAGNGSELHPHRMTYDWQQLHGTRKNCYIILRLKQGFDRHFSIMGKSLRFTITYSKANNKSKSVW